MAPMAPFAISNCPPEAPPSGQGTEYALTIEAAQQQAGVHPGRERCRQGQAGVRQGPDQDQVEDHIRRHGNHGNTDGRGHVLPREIPRRQHFHQHEGHQRQRIGPEALCGHDHILVGRLPVMEQGRDHGLGEQTECQPGWNTQQQYRTQRPVQGARECLPGFGGVFSGEVGKNHGADRHPENPSGNSESRSE